MENKIFFCRNCKKQISLGGIDFFAFIKGVYKLEDINCNSAIFGSFHQPMNNLEMLEFKYERSLE